MLRAAKSVGLFRAKPFNARAVRKRIGRACAVVRVLVINTVAIKYGDNPRLTFEASIGNVCASRCYYCPSRLGVVQRLPNYPLRACPRLAPPTPRENQPSFPVRFRR